MDRQTRSSQYSAPPLPEAEYWLCHHTRLSCGRWLASTSKHMQCRINANRGPWQLFSRAPLLTRDKDLSQPAIRVDTTCWQLFRPDINTAHFLFFVAEVNKLCQIT